MIEKQSISVPISLDALIIEKNKIRGSLSYFSLDCDVQYSYYARKDW